MIPLIVRLFDLRDFSMCEPDWRPYKAQMEFDVPRSVEPTICVFPRPGTIHGVKIAAIRFRGWSEEEALQFIDRNDIKEWTGTQLRG